MGGFFPLNLFVIVSFHIQIIKGSEPSNVVAIQIHMEPVESVCVGGRVNFFFLQVDNVVKLCYRVAIKTREIC